MKSKIYSTFFLCIFSLYSYSQGINSFKYTLNAGINFAKSKYSGFGSTEISQNLNLPEFGITAFSSLEDKTFFQTGLILSGKGGQFSAYGEYEKASLYYIELPMYYGYRLQIPNLSNINVSIFGGGHVGYALFGKLKSKYDGDPELVEDVFSGDVASQPKRFNLGLGLGVNLEVSQKYILTLKKTNSLMNIEKDSGDYKDRFQNFTVGFSYVF